MAAGIYWIRNLINGNLYIGQSVDLDNRKRQHYQSLRRGDHYNRILTRAYKKYGENNLRFEVLVYLDQDADTLILFEQRFIDALHPVYNTSPTAGTCLGFKHTEEARMKMRMAKKGYIPWNKGVHTIGKKHTEEMKEKMSISVRNRSKDIFKKISKSKKKWHENNRDRWKDICETISNTKAKTYPGVVAPDGTIYESIHNLHRFAMEHDGISDGGFRMLFRGDKNEIKGWRLYKP